MDRGGKRGLKSSTNFTHFAVVLTIGGCMVVEPYASEELGTRLADRLIVLTHPVSGPRATVLRSRSCRAMS